ncbi:MAG: hypothetical protein VX701_02420 [Chloroflexota bacterium]|nr:hypothetical protein [Chloroflexota bacterium]
MTENLMYKMDDFASLLKERIPSSQYELLESISSIADSNGVALYLVGGMVRDILLSTSYTDPDLCIEGGSTDFVKLLSAELAGNVIAQSEFGTTKVELNGTIVDFAIARKEKYQYEGALPEVEEGTIIEDLGRRDFSINSMAVSMNSRNFGELIDPNNGCTDLENRVIRALHPGSFLDDPTRLLRAARYAGRLGFTLDTETKKWMISSLNILKDISGDRIRHEIEHILRENQALNILSLAEQLGILETIYPSLKIPYKLGKSDAVFGQHRESALLSMLAYSLPLGHSKSFVDRLNLGRNWSKIVTDSQHVLRLIRELSSDLSASNIYALLSDLHDIAICVGSLYTEPPVSDRLKLYIEKLRHVKTSLDGQDLLNMGVPQGALVGKILNELLVAKLDGHISSAADERETVCRILRDN